MITFVIAGLIIGLFYLLWRNELQAKSPDQKSSSGNVPLWLLLGILSVIALLSPKIRDKIKDLRQKHRL